MRQRSTALRPAAVWLLVCLLTGCAGMFGFLSGYTATRSGELAPALAHVSTPVEQGAAEFIYGDLGGLSTDALETNATPWKVMLASLAMARAEHEHRPLSRDLLNGILAPYGFFVPDSIVNWPGPDPAPRFTQPIGVV